MLEAQEKYGRAPLLTELYDEDMDEGMALKSEFRDTDNQKSSRREELMEHVFPEKKSFEDDEPQSPNEWSTSADAPLLMNTAEDEGGAEESTTETKESANTESPAHGPSEYKVAFSHFVVSKNAQSK